MFLFLQIFVCEWCCHYVWLVRWFFFFCFRRIFLWLVVYTWVAVIFGTVRQDFQIILERMWWRFSVVWTLDCVILSGWLNQTSTWLVSESYGLFLYPLLSGMLVLPSNRVYPTSLLLFTNILLIAMLQNSDILINTFLNFVLIFSFTNKFIFDTDSQVVAILFDFCSLWFSLHVHMTIC